MRFESVWWCPRQFARKVAQVPTPVPLTKRRHWALTLTAWSLSWLAWLLEHCNMKNMKILRAQLMVEELGETIDAMNRGDAAAMLDGQCDLVYVVGGTIDAFGFNDCFLDAFRQTHESNMTKANRNGKPRVRDKGDGWAPVDYARILKEYGYVSEEL